MKEADIKNLLKQSIKSPSPDFTEKVMASVVLKEQTARKLNPKMLFIVLLFTAVVILSFILRMPEINLYRFNFKLSPTFTVVFSSSFILFCLSRLIDVYHVLASHPPPVAGRG